jgi:hypothetical protein
LTHEPVHLDVIASVSPVAQGVHIAEIEFALQPYPDARESAGDFSRDKRFRHAWRPVIEKDSVAGIDAVCLTVVHRNPVSVKHGDCIGGPRVEGRGLRLRNLLH